MATAGINAILPQNKVAGAAPVLVGTPTFYFLTDPTTYPGNPQVAVTLQRTGLPIFFARIWRSAAATVTASAKAEAYNPAKSQTTTGNFIPITLKNVKPLLVANQDSGGNPFVDITTGAVLATGGGTATNAYVDTGMTRGNLGSQAGAGLQCLIHDPSNDTIDPASPYPNGPTQIIAGSGPFKGKLVSTSQSIANFPIINSGPTVPLPPSGDVKIIGFLQAFIEDVSPGGSPLSITVRIMNIAGCGNNPGSTFVQAGGTSAIPVRLISQ